MKKTSALLLALSASAVLLCAGCGSNADTSSVDAESSATAAVIPLGEDVSLRVGTEPDGEVLLDLSNTEGFMASPDYTEEMPYGFALVLTNEGKKDFRVATRDLAKEQSPVTLWAGDEALCSPVITAMMNTKYVILSIASVTDDESYNYVVDCLSGK